MEDRAHAVQYYAYPGTLPFGYLAATSDKQHLDIPPRNVRSCRVSEDRLQYGTVFRCQIHSINI